MANIIIGMGGNVGDTIAVFSKALYCLNGFLTDIAKSSVYKSDSLLPGKQRYYLNMIITGRTDVSFKMLLQKCKNIEKNMGRKRTGKWGERIIDLDIIDYDGIIYQDSELTIPHPEMVNRSFVLYPLREVAPNYIHPITGKST